MYYVLFTHTKVKKGTDFRAFKFEKEVIEFLHNSHEDIEVYRIIETARSYRLGLVVTEELIKSVLEPGEETESLVELERKPEEILKENKKALEELETEKPTAMEKIIDDTKEEMEKAKLTPEERTKKALSEADLLIAREKLRQEQKKKGWELCIKCNSNRVAPWNKKKICSPCQNEKKTNRPYSSRSKEFPGL